MTAWPNPNDYVEALQNPALAFDDPVLKHGVVTLDKLGLPRPISGNFAIVFEVANRDQRWAVRCFARETPGQEARYAAIARHLSRHKLPFMVGFEYLPRGVRVRGQWYPVVKMEWVRGVRLDIYIEQHLNQPEALLKLALEWDAVMRAMQRAQIAHGDLQHGNIVIAHNDIRLIDYDGMIVPDLVGKPGGEIGHRHYQHPSRTSDQGVNAANYLRVDHFSAWVIWASLLSVSLDPALWRRVDAGDDRLLFGEGDYKDPAKSNIINLLFRHPDARLRDAAQRLLPVLQARSYLDCPPLNAAGILEQRPAPGGGWLGDYVGDSAPSAGSATAAGRDWLDDYRPSSGTRPAQPAPPPIESPLPRPVDNGRDPLDFSPAFLIALRDRLRRDYAAMSTLQRMLFAFNPQWFIASSVRLHFDDFPVVKDKKTVEATYHALSAERAAAAAALDDALRNEAGGKQSFENDVNAIMNHMKALEDEALALDAETAQRIEDYRETAKREREALLLRDHPIKTKQVEKIGKSKVEALQGKGIFTYADITPANKMPAILALMDVKNSTPDVEWAALERKRDELLSQFDSFHLPPDDPTLLAIQNDHAARRADLETQYNAAQARLARMEGDQNPDDPNTYFGRLRAAVLATQARLADLDAQLAQAARQLERYRAITPDHLLRKLRDLP